MSPRSWLKQTVALCAAVALASTTLWIAGCDDGSIEPPPPAPEYGTEPTPQDPYAEDPQGQDPYSTTPPAQPPATPQQ